VKDKQTDDAWEDWRSDWMETHNAREMEKEYLRWEVTTMQTATEKPQKEM
jgi:hypothetical protein